MKTKIELILGFLESGKTNFINSMIKSDEFENETIVIIQDEFGQSDIEYSKDELMNKNINIINLEHDSENEINSSYIKNIIHDYVPDRMKNAHSIVNLFNERNIRNMCKIDDIISLIDIKNFSLYFRNLKEILTSQIVNSNKIILNNIDEINKTDFNTIVNEIKNINETALILGHSSSNEEIETHSYNEYYEINNTESSRFNFKSYIYIFLIMFLFTFLSTLPLLDQSIYFKYMDKLQKFYTIFVSILIEGIPFILIGSFISAIIQICIPNEFFMKVFPSNIFLSCIAAAFGGFIFPICDCGTIPIVKGFMAKKVPIAACITFMLAAPIVNPIAILSTIYAFQGLKSVVIYRILSGVIIAISVGLIMHIITQKNPNIFTDNNIESDCSCIICNNSTNSNNSVIEKIINIFIHTGDEFFNIGKFMIIGAFCSSIFQSIISINNNVYMPNDNRTSLIIMILLSFLLSVCSTSDAFIAKGFLGSFSLNSVMGFLIVGPMVDLKNTFMLFGNFKKSFVLKLIFFIMIISFTVLINLNLS